MLMTTRRMSMFITGRPSPFAYLFPCFSPTAASWQWSRDAQGVARSSLPEWTRWSCLACARVPGVLLSLDHTCPCLWVAINLQKWGSNPLSSFFQVPVSSGAGAIGIEYASGYCICLRKPRVGCPASGPTWCLRPRPSTFSLGSLSQRQAWRVTVQRVSS